MHEWKFRTCAKGPCGSGKKYKNCDGA
ncbi:SEC-C metal-binding domain-containing protein [Neobacillus drentensis]